MKLYLIILYSCIFSYLYTVSKIGQNKRIVLFNAWTSHMLMITLFSVFDFNWERWNIIYYMVFHRSQFWVWEIFKFNLLAFSQPVTLDSSLFIDIIIYIRAEIELCSTPSYFLELILCTWVYCCLFADNQSFILPLNP